MAMLIGLSGASGSGKTTLATALAEELENRGYDVGVVSEVVREVFKKWQKACGFQNLQDIRRSPVITEFQHEVFREQVKREDEARKAHNIVITDRTIYDNLFFTIFYHGNDFNALEKYIREFSEVELRSSARRYSTIFLCSPLWQEDVDDGFRTVDLKYRNLQQFMIYRLIPRETQVYLVPNYFRLEKDEAVRKRVEYCMYILQEAGLLEG